jgi:hypothetical protein
MEGCTQDIRANFKPITKPMFFINKQAVLCSQCFSDIAHILKPCFGGTVPLCEKCWLDIEEGCYSEEEAGWEA